VFSRRFRDAVAFHGLANDADGDDAAVVLVGGGMASHDLQTHIVGAIIQRVGSDVSVRAAGPGDRFNGDDGSNIVNRLTIGGKTASRSSKAPWPEPRTGTTSLTRFGRVSISALTPRRGLITALFAGR
jgi:hypothetical protein